MKRDRQLVCPKCNAEFDQLYKLFLHCKKKHPEVRFEFETVEIGVTRTKIRWPVRIIKGD